MTDQTELEAVAVDALRHQLWSKDHPVSEWELETVRKIAAAIDAHRIAGADGAVKGVAMLAGTLRGWQRLPSDEQPHYPGGMRPFSNGDLAYFEGGLREAAALILAQKAEIARLRKHNESLRKQVLEPCRHTRTAEQETDRPDLHDWQTAQHEWFDATILEIVSEYAAWRDGQEREVNGFIPRKQLVLHDPPHSYGDCQRTCLAMALGLAPEEVPHFGDANLFPIAEARAAERAWLASRGYGYVQVPIHGEWGQPWLENLLEQQRGTPVIVSGKSPRGDWNHDVVYLDGEVFDPHPDGTGLAGPCIDNENPDEPRWFWINILCLLPAIERNPLHDRI